ncbi:hypothetical protein PoB_001552500 [Plakobranchus ocellatus]|uniref:Uncharacterized protein n=1 Tax=Plakobranchus ocellatus TaxID=259542 RepID=A0AAV3Z331_9GAST|nr:hypothetical protein PoB_001552500 [Plakobranchus ocellatus]
MLSPPNHFVVLNNKLKSPVVVLTFVSADDDHDDDSASAPVAVACVGSDDTDDDTAAVADISDNDHINLNDSLSDFESKITQKKLADHIKNRIHPLLVENKKAVEKPGLDNTNPLWMNNCCESINHILKQAVSWKSQKLVDLIHKLHSVVQMQFKELRRALTDTGEFVLCPDVAKFKISRDVWLNLEQKQKIKNIKKFHVPFSELDFVRSTDGQKVLKEPCHEHQK